MKFDRFFAEISISEKYSKFEVVFDGVKKLRGVRTTLWLFYYLYKSK
jgi:hypothetical protein